MAQDIPAINGSRGRITIYCVAETLNRDLLTKKLRERGPQFLLHSYPDVLYGRYHKCAARVLHCFSSTCFLPSSNPCCVGCALSNNSG